MKVLVLLALSLAAFAQVPFDPPTVGASILTQDSAYLPSILPAVPCAPCAWGIAVWAHWTDPGTRGFYVAYQYRTADGQTHSSGALILASWTYQGTLAGQTWLTLGTERIFDPRVTAWYRITEVSNVGQN